MNDGAVIDLIAGKVDSTTLELVRDALHDSARMAVIRDMFLAGRDGEAIREIQALNPRQIYQYLPMSSGVEIGYKESALIIARPQLHFSATRLLVGRDCARHFVINEMRVRNMSQMVSYGDIPADLFAGDLDSVENPIRGELVDGFWTVSIERRAVPLIGLPISFVECDPGAEISLSVTNIDGSISGEGGRRFRAALLGFTRGH